MDEGQFTQMMDIAQSMLASKRLIGGPAVMHDGALVIRDDPDGRERFSPSLEMRGVMGELLGPTDMHPTMRGADPHGRFIQMQQWLLMQRGLEWLLNGSQRRMALLDKAGDAASRELDSQHVLEDLAGAGVGNDLSFDQVHRQRGDASTVLGGSLDFGGKARTGDVRTVRTGFLLHPIFLDPQAFFGQVQDLAAFGIAGRLPPQVVLTVLADLDRMDQHLIRKLDLLKMMAPMTRLATCFLAALLPQTLGRAHEVIRRGRQAAVVAIFGFLPLQFFDSLLRDAPIASKACFNPARKVSFSCRSCSISSSLVILVV